MAVLKSQLQLSLLDQVSSPIRKISGALSAFQRQTSAVGAPFRSLAGQVLAIGAGYLGATNGIDSTIGAAMRFESAFADVRKVVDGTDQQLEYIRQTIKQMSTEIPIASEDMAALFAAAGESGIATNDLKQFAEMAARVGIAFDMSAGDAGESLAKLKTQFGLSVAETGDLADAVNHLSNNMASKAKDITDYLLRIGSLSQMAGFAKEEVAALGSAMIAAGAPAEIAATAMQNVAKAMTRGEFAKKGQREVAAALGLDLPTLAKQMQKDAPKALKSVLTAISKQSKDKHIALLSAFFGDEAKAFAPLVGNIKLLDQALDSVSDKAKYGGSAFREFTARANTTANVLQLLRNRFSNIFETFGEGFLPTIRNAANGINDVLDTLGERATIFDKIGASFDGFMQGFAPDSDLRSFINDLGDLLLGVADGSKSADELGRIFAKFRQWGEDVRAFADAVANNPIAQFLGSLAPYGFQIMLWGAGIAFLAGTIRKLAAALMFLSGASTIVAALKAVGSIAAIVGGGGAATAAGTAAGAGAAGATGAAAGAAGRVPWLTGLARMGLWGAAAAGAWQLGSAVNNGDTPYSRGQTILPGFEDLLHSMKQVLGDKMASNGSPEFQAGWNNVNDQFLADWNRQHGGGDTASVNSMAPDITYDPKMPRFMGQGAYPYAGDTAMKLDGGTIAALLQPSGTQDVRVTNPPPPPNVTVNAPITINGVSDPQAAASSAAAQLGQKTKAAVESSLTGNPSQ